jgi:hypothetical protein
MDNYVRDFRSSSIAGYPILFWGTVKAQYSALFAVDVVLDVGQLLKAVPVMSPTWAGENTDRAFGTRDLPPVDSEVPVLIPDGIFENSIVLPFSRLNFSTKMTTDLVVSGKERESLSINEKGWKVTYDKATGTWSAETPSGNDQVKIAIDRSANTITVTQKDGASAKNEIVLTKTSGITITDRNGNTFTMGSTSVTINGNLEVLR